MEVRLQRGGVSSFSKPITTLLIASLNFSLQVSNKCPSIIHYVFARSITRLRIFRQHSGDVVKEVT